MQASLTGPGRWGTTGTGPTGLEIHQHDDDDGALRVSLVGEIDIAVTDALAFRLREFARVRRPVRLDLTRLRFIDGTGMAALVRAITSMRAVGCKLEVCRIVTRAVAMVVDLTGVAPALWPDLSGARAPATIVLRPGRRSAEVAAICVGLADDRQVVRSGRPFLFAIEGRQQEGAVAYTPMTDSHTRRSGHGELVGKQRRGDRPAGRHEDAPSTGNTRGDRG